MPNITTIPPQCLVANPPEACLRAFSLIHYLPTIPGNATYLAIFALLIAIQIFLGVRYKTWSFMTIILCGLALEVVGYGGRIWERSSPYATGPFTMYISCITIAPAFFTAAIYLCLGRIVQVHGTHLSRFQPRTYTFLFVGTDFLCLVLQGTGGGIASTANTSHGAQIGIDVMIGGLALQVASLGLFLVLWADFAWKKHNRTSAREGKFASLSASGRFKAFQWGLLTATVLIFVRCVYRVVELSAGFNSALANNEVIFMILEGPMCFLAVTALSALHPGHGFGGQWAQTSAFHRGRGARGDAAAGGLEGKRGTGGA